MYGFFEGRGEDGLVLSNGTTLGRTKGAMGNQIPLGELAQAAPLPCPSPLWALGGGAGGRKKQVWLIKLPG